MHVAHTLMRAQLCQDVISVTDLVPMTFSKGHTHTQTSVIAILHGQKIDTTTVVVLLGVLLPSVSPLVRLTPTCADGYISIVSARPPPPPQTPTRYKPKH